MRWAILTAVPVLAVACGRPASQFCGPTTCGGCCDSVGECHSGLENADCGSDGERCRFCGGDTFCEQAVCVSKTLPGGAGGGAGGTGGGTSTGGGVGTGGGFGGGGFGAGGGGPRNDAGFPAAHPPFPQVLQLGGPVMAHPRFMSVTFVNDSPVVTGPVEDFLATVGTTPYWNEVTGEYGVGQATAAPPVHINEQPVGTLTFEEIDRWVQQHLTGESPALGAPDPDTLYVITYPTNVTVTLGAAESCVAFGGYHFATSVDGGAVVYAVIPRCANVIAGHNDADQLTGVISHELIEAVTDPIPFPLPAWGQVDPQHMAWNMTVGGELADLCTFDSDAYFTPAGYSHLVQRSWSNRAAAEGGHTCVPATGNAFGAVPELDDAVSFDWKDIALKGTTDGVHIPLGQQRDVVLDLYSETPELLWVSAVGYPTPYTLDISFPGGASGWNGDQVRLSVRHNSDEPSLGGAPMMISTTTPSGLTHYYFAFIGD